MSDKRYYKGRSILFPFGGEFQVIGNIHDKEVTAMAKYRGKYKKCRSCVHAVEALMELVIVLETCPKLFKSRSGTLFSDKHVCEGCESYKGVDDNAKSSTTNR